jgi:hypothetical protein
MKENNIPKSIGCEFCSKHDKYLMCKNCFKNLKNLNKSYKLDLKKSSDKLEESIEKLLQINYEKGEKLNNVMKSMNDNETLINNINKQKNKNNELENKIKELEQLINNKKKLLSEEKDKIYEIVNKIDKGKYKKNTNILIGSLNISNDELLKSIINSNEFTIFEELSKNIIQDKKKFLKEFFDLLIIKTNSLIKIKDFFTNNENKLSVMNIINIYDNGKYSIDKDKDLFVNCPIVLKSDILEDNQINCLKFNKFFSIFQKFVLLSSIRLGINLTYKMNYPYIISKDGNKYQYLIYPQKSWITNKININNIIKGLTLLNSNYNLILQNVFGESIKTLWFNFSPLINDNEIFEKVSIKNENISIPCDGNLEINGYILVSKTY